eukprot:4156801-Prymnesium_polylepis.2
MVLLTERRFAAAEKDEDFTDQTLHPVGAWMDYWETRYISEFDTFVNGFNRTKGGQGGGWLVAMREAKAESKGDVRAFPDNVHARLPGVLREGGRRQRAPRASDPWKAASQHPDRPHSSPSPV